MKERKGREEEVGGKVERGSTKLNGSGNGKGNGRVRERGRGERAMEMERGRGRESNLYDRQKSDAVTNIASLKRTNAKGN